MKKTRPERSRRIAIASSGKTLQSPVDPRFGRCPYFLIVESKSDEFKVIENTAGQTFRGASISAAQMIANQGVKAIIAGNFGPNAVNVLRASNIKIFPAFGISAKQALQKYRTGELTEITTHTPSFGPPSQAGQSFGPPRGRGRGSFNFNYGPKIKRSGGQGRRGGART